MAVNLEDMWKKAWAMNALERGGQDALGANILHALGGASDAGIRPPSQMPIAGMGQPQAPQGYQGVSPAWQPQRQPFMQRLGGALRNLDASPGFHRSMGLLSQGVYGKSAQDAMSGYNAMMEAQKQKHSKDMDIARLEIDQANEARLAAADRRAQATRDANIKNALALKDRWRKYATSAASEGGPELTDNEQLIEQAIDEVIASGGNLDLGSVTEMMRARAAMTTAANSPGAGGASAQRVAQLKALFSEFPGGDAMWAQLPPDAKWMLAQAPAGAYPELSTVDGIRELVSLLTGTIRPPTIETPEGPKPLTPDMQVERELMLAGKRVAPEAYKDALFKVETYDMALNTADDAMDLIAKNADKLLGIDVNWAAGWGSMLQGFPQTSAKDLHNKLKTLRARMSFEELQKMRDASTTGGALGQVSNLEISLLASAIATLDQAADPESLTQALETISRRLARLRKWSQLESDLAKEYVSNRQVEAMAAAEITRIRNDPELRAAAEAGGSMIDERAAVEANQRARWGKTYAEMTEDERDRAMEHMNSLPTVPMRQ